MSENSVIPEKRLATRFGDVAEEKKSEVQTLRDCYASTTVNLATALRFFSRTCSLESREMLESEHHLFTALRVRSSPALLQMIHKYIKGWKVGLEAKMGFPVSEADSLPMNAKSLVGSVMSNFCGSHFPLHMPVVEVTSEGMMIDRENSNVSEKQSASSKVLNNVLFVDKIDSIHTKQADGVRIFA